MNIPVLTFFNNKGGVGKTSLVYHLAWILSQTGHRVLTCDLDPQANLSAAFLNECGPCGQQRSLTLDVGLGPAVLTRVAWAFRGHTPRQCSAISR